MESTLLITDVKEKEATEPKAPSFPQIRSTNSGFPEHKKRTRISAFKQKRLAQGQDQGRGQGQGQEPGSKVSTTVFSPSSPKNGAQPPGGPTDESPEAKERRRIDQENNDRLGTMSPDEIEAARQELFGSLDAATLERLLKRVNLDESNGPSPFDLPEPTSQLGPATTTKQARDSIPEIRVEDTLTKPNMGTRDLRATVEDEHDEDDERGREPPEPTAGTSSSTKKRVHFSSQDHPSDAPPLPPPSTDPTATTATTDPPRTRTIDDDAAPPVPPAEHVLHATDPRVSRPHWPRPPQSDVAADLDPADPDFLEKLHGRYFPALPADPSRLAWMAPLPTPGSAADLESPYHPARASVASSALRFDFAGRLLPPRIARAVPASRGLHHHAEAPEAAGYTVPELARLARSAVPGQRCLAHQTLGRLLYRLGAGGLGRPGDDLADAVWGLVRDGAVLRTLGDEAALDDGDDGDGYAADGDVVSRRHHHHRTARTFAIEALWLFEKGGWKERLRRGK